MSDDMDSMDDGEEDEPGGHHHHLHHHHHDPHGVVVNVEGLEHGIDDDDEVCVSICVYVSMCVAERMLAVYYNA
jgi:hypothetical protein